MNQSTPTAVPQIEADPAQPTYAPAAMAMGIAMLAWGLLTHWSLSVAGAALIAWSLGSWIGAVARQWRISE